MPIKLAETGVAAEIKPETLCTVFKRCAEIRGDFPSMKVMRDKKELSWTWRQYYSDAFAFAKSLNALGLDDKKAVNIMGFNSPEWAIALFGSVLNN